MNIHDIDRLAELSRLDIPQEEKEQVLKDMTSIIGYVDQIQAVSVGHMHAQDIPIQRNIFREDKNPNDPGALTDALIDQMPSHEGTHLKVPRIL